MFDNLSEAEARQHILEIVASYCDKYHAVKQYEKGDRMP